MIKQRRLVLHQKHSKWLEDFVQESLNIEDIWRKPTEEELEVTWNFIKRSKLEIKDLVELVKVYQPNAVIRDNPWHRVWIGGHEAPKGGETLLQDVSELLYNCNKSNLDIRKTDPYFVHCQYEHLHPFTDGNGRSGRAIWANLMWHKGYDFKFKFLQMFYYQTLQRYKSIKDK